MGVFKQLSKFQKLCRGVGGMTKILYHSVSKLCHGN